MALATLAHRGTAANYCVCIVDRDRGCQSIKAVQPGRAFDLTPFAAGSVIYLIMWSVCRPYASRERSATALNVTIALALALGMIAVNASLLFGAA